MFESPLDWLKQYGDRGLVSLERLSPQTLAYLGDAVFELYTRTCYLSPPRRLADHHRQVVAKVKAESQAEKLQQLLPHLTEIEKDWVRRGRNGATGCPRRLPLAVYQQATG
ncbi:MAG: ribonuclease III domain-containing protein, partial [Microcystaceae cyanobacterium]